MRVKGHCWSASATGRHLRSVRPHCIATKKVQLAEPDVKRLLDKDTEHDQVSERRRVLTWVPNLVPTFAIAVDLHQNWLTTRPHSSSTSRPKPALGHLQMLSQDPTLTLASPPPIRSYPKSVPDLARTAAAAAASAIVVPVALVVFARHSPVHLSTIQTLVQLPQPVPLPPCHSSHWHPPQPLAERQPGLPHRPPQIHASRR